MKRAIYAKQFKLAAIKMAGEAGACVKTVVYELGISMSSLRRWINEYD